MGNKSGKIVKICRGDAFLRGGSGLWPQPGALNALSGKGETTGSDEGPRLRLSVPLMSPLFSKEVPVAEVNGRSDHAEGAHASLGLSP